MTPAGGAEGFFAPATPFQLVASFDDSSPNLVAGLGYPGFIAHTPISARMTIDGTEYSVAAFPDDPTGGITIAIFDQTNPFVTGKYGVGFIVDPVLDGAGIIGRFGDATTNFTVDALVETELTGFIGAGFRSGPGAPPGACYANPALCAVVPISLSDINGAQYELRLGTRAENVWTPSSCMRRPSPRFRPRQSRAGASRDRGCLAGAPATGGLRSHPRPGSAFGPSYRTPAFVAGSS